MIEDIRCPYCHSSHVVTKNTGRKVGSTIGATGGAIHGVTGALSGARAGASVGSKLGVVAGPLGTGIGTIAGAILGGIVGATTFGFMGAKMGELIDNTILDNHECLDCGQSFNPNNFIAEIPLEDNIHGSSGRRRISPMDEIGHISSNNEEYDAIEMGDISSPPGGDWPLMLERPTLPDFNQQAKNDYHEGFYDGNHGDTGHGDSEELNNP